ncbi:MAG: hypothetical protein R3C17_05105 [Planctomycetaceae bacterium]
MRILKHILMPLLMAGLMILGVTLFRQNNKRWTTVREASAGTTEALPQVNALQPEVDVEQYAPSPVPVPDIISEPITSWPESIRQVSQLHPEMLTPGNFEYLGAFLPPHFEENEKSFAYSSGVLAFRPNPDRPETETTLSGSLFLAGHAQHQRVAEITIPKPVLSPLKRTTDLPRAEMLQPFADVTHGIMQELADTLNGADFRLGGLQVVGDRLHWTTHIYYNPGQFDTATHGCCPLDLSQSEAEGPWHLGNGASPAPDCHSDKHAGYIFTIPQTEADHWFGGRNLISGLWTATGLQNSSHGPAMFAYRLPESLLAGGAIESLPLAWYSMDQPLDQHHPADRWGGGAWLTLGNKQTIIIIGQKALGPVYYGLARPEDCDENKGYHGTPYESQVYFYSPASLIHVAHGAMSPNAVQPWMRWTSATAGGGFDQYLFPRCYRDVGGVAWDQEHQLLYVSQPNAGTTPDHPWHAQPLIHVFRIVE